MVIILGLGGIVIIIMHKPLLSKVLYKAGKIIVSISTVIIVVIFIFPSISIIINKTLGVIFALFLEFL